MGLYAGSFIAIRELRLHTAGEGLITNNWRGSEVRECVLSSCGRDRAGPLVIGGGFKRGSLGEDLSAACDTATNSADRWRPLRSGVQSGWRMACVWVCKIGCQAVFTYHWVRSFSDIQLGPDSPLPRDSLTSHLSVLSLMAPSPSSPSLPLLF